MLIRVTGQSFPSGHTVQAVAVYGTLALLLSGGRSRRIQVVMWSAAALVALAVGASRLYLGVHWLTDVLAGYALGGLVVVVAAAAMLALGSGPRSDRT